MPGNPRKVAFDVEATRYEVEFNPALPGEVLVTTTSDRHSWNVEVAEVRASAICLSGMTDRLPGVTDDQSWFVLTLGPEEKIEYWGDRILHRCDRSRSSERTEPQPR